MINHSMSAPLIILLSLPPLPPLSLVLPPSTPLGLYPQCPGSGPALASRVGTASDDVSRCGCQCIEDGG